MLVVHTSIFKESPELFRILEMLQQKEAYMRAMALEYETNQGDYSFFGNSEYVGYKPYKALLR